MEELWVKNNTGLDVGLGDLGMKIPANSTVDIYKRSHYITAIKVEASLSDGSLYKRITSNTLEIVQGRANLKPHTLNHLKASTKPTQVVKTKSSVVIDTAEMDVLEDGDLGDIADYGLGDVNANVDYVKDETGAVVVQQHEDEPEEEVPEVKVNIEAMKSAGVSEQVIRVVVKETNELVEDKLKGKVHVVKPPEDKPEEVVQVDAEAELKVESRGDMVVVNELKQPEVLTKDSESFDTQVATKDESGTIIMKLKEVKEVVEPKKTAKKKSKPRKKTTKKK